MSIVGSLLSQLRSKLGARKIAMLVLNAFVQLVRWSASLTWWPSSKFGHHICRWASGVGKKILRSSRTIFFVSFSPNSVLAIHQTGNKPKISTIQVPCWNVLKSVEYQHCGSIWIDNHCASALEQATKAPQLVQITELPSWPLHFGHIRLTLWWIMM